VTKKQRNWDDAGASIRGMDAAFERAAGFSIEFVERYFNKTRRFRNVEAHLNRAELAALIGAAIVQFNQPPEER
jgi:hypothetical protein